MEKQIKIKGLYKFFAVVLAVLIVATAITAVTFTVYFKNTFNDFYNAQYSLIHDRIAGNVISEEYTLWQQGSLIVGNIDVALYISDKQTDDSAKHRAIQTINNLKGVLSVRSIQIFSDGGDAIWNGENMNKTSFEEYLKQNAEFNDIYKRYQGGENFFISEDKRNITYFYEDYRSFTVVFKIDREEFEQKIVYAKADEKNDVWVYYKNDEPVIGSENNILKELPKIKEKTDSGGNSEFVYKNMLYICNNVRDVLCISRFSYANLIGAALSGAPFIWILIAMLLVIIGVAIYFAVKYIRQLMAYYMWQFTEFSKSEEKGKTELSIIRLFISRKQSADDVNAICNIFQSGTGRYYMSLILIIDEPEKLSNEPEIIGGVNYKTKINKIVHNVLSGEGTCVSVGISDEKIGVLFNTDNPENIKRHTGRINDEIKKLCGTTISVIKSRVTTDISQIGDCINSVRAISEYRFVSGTHSFVDEEEIIVRNGKCEYPIAVQNEMIKACVDKNFEKVEELLNEFITYIAENDYTMAENWTIMLFVNIIRNIKTADKTLNFQTVGMLVKSSTFEEAAKRFIDYLKTDEEEISEQLSGGNSFLIKVEKITEQNYGSADYDLNALAYELDNSAVHVSRKFKKLSGQNFSQYLSAYRIQKAMDLLENTEMRIGEIAEKCGFGSGGYFSTIFKKHTSMTPQEYREKKIYEEK